MKEILNSKNGLLQIVLAAALALAAAVGLDPQGLGAIITAVVAFVGVAREWLRSGVKFRWDSNVWTYAVAFLVVTLPSWTEVWNLLPELFGAIKSNNLNLIIASGIAILNVLMRRFGSRAVLVKGLDEKDA